MNRASHVLNHLNQENLHINKHRNDGSATSKKYRISENYCDIKLADCCAKLCQWIYNISNPKVDQSLPVHPLCNQYDDKGWNIIKTESGNTSQNITSYSILSPKISKDTLFIVFAGTQPDKKPLHVAVDLCAVHQPLVDPSNPSIPIAHVHTGIYGDMKRDFHTIHHRFLSAENLRNIKNVVVTGHSLGGGLAILFTYNTLRFKRHFDDIKLDVVTFGAPMVFADVQNHQIIQELSEICHNFINLYDPVPRLPGATQWVQDILPAMLKKITQDKLGKMRFVPYFTGKINDVLDILTNKINNPETLELFSGYFPCGKYYFIGENKIKISASADITKKHLFYNPFDLNDLTIDFMEVAENHFISQYIQTLGMHSRNDHVVSLSKFKRMQDNVKKKELIHVLNEISKNSSDNLLNEIKTILDENEKNMNEKYKNVLEIITRQLAQQNESQLLKYTEILNQTREQTDNESKHFEEFKKIVSGIETQKENEAKKYKKLLHEIKTQNKLLQQTYNEHAHYEDLKDSQQLHGNVVSEIEQKIKILKQEIENKGMGWKQMLSVNIIGIIIAGMVMRAYKGRTVAK